MQLTLRDYQKEAVQSIYTYFGSNTGNPVVAMPTGTGKAVVIAGFLEGLYRQYPRQRVMMLTHVKELIVQNYEKLMELWPQAPAGVYSAGLERKEFYRPITFGGVASVWRRPELFGHQDLVLIDECHLVSPNEEAMYGAFLSGLKAVNPCLKVIGFTATPWRLGQGHITSDGLFTDVCFDITGVDAFNRLIAEGYLSPLIPRATRQQLDVDGVHLRGGEFVPKELQSAIDREEITYGALGEMLELAADRAHWLIFASGIEHSNHIVQMLDTMGVSAVSVHSKMPGKQRDEAIAGFKSGKYRVAVNNNVLTTGFDFPAIDCIGVLRPTASTVLWVQMLGRGTRPSPGKQNCLVLDFAANTRRLGPINDPVIPRKKGAGGGEAPVRICDACGVYNHASARHCFNCGAEFTFQVKFNQFAATDTLIKGDAPLTEVLQVDHVTYSKHTKIMKPPSVRVTYYCGLRSFSEFVLFEHEGYGQRKAREWWRERSVAEVPTDVTSALLELPQLRVPTHIRVWTNKKPYPSILAWCFDGTAFGMQPPGTSQPSVQVDTRASAGLTDDDIPF